MAHQNPNGRHCHKPQQAVETFFLAGSCMAQCLFFWTICCARRDDSGSLANPNKVMVDSVVLILDWNDKTRPNKQGTATAPKNNTHQNPKKNPPSNPEKLR